MSAPYARAPHQGSPVQIAAPNAALLIDFDNVTMGIRSDLTKELRALLNSDIIKGKVAVQRAYADWRRYPQYIVPLSEASIDLIFAPAYGSSKKNATDIRLAIDALELVFTRPEIGTFILLSGDSDFSSMVLKLKEYGKYVIGVGIRESSSDLLVQNCDEYYSYSALTGLTKAGEESVGGEDPWVLVERAVRQMSDQNDVMRSDRLKQVMLDIDPSFDEKALGFSKYNRFLSDAASRGCLTLRKMDNGQYEVGPPESDEPAESRPRGGRGRGRRSESQDVQAEARGGREAAQEQREKAEEPERKRRSTKSAEPPKERRVEASPRAARASRGEPAAEGGEGSIQEAYDLLRRAVAELYEERGGAVRDSDIKRRMLELRDGWDESAYGFPKFSRFLRQAHGAEIIDLRKTEEGAYEAEPRGAAPPPPRGRGAGRERRRDSAGRGETAAERGERRSKQAEPEPAAAEGVVQEEMVEAMPAAEAAPQSQPIAEAAPLEEPAAEPAPAAPVTTPEAPGAAEEGARRHRRGSLGVRRGRHGTEPPPMLPGQVVGASAEASRTSARDSGPDTRESQADAAAGSAASTPGTEPPDLVALGLPTDGDAVVNYLQNSYKGVGQKTAEALVEALGAANVFDVLRDEPGRVADVLGGHRSAAVLEGWEADYQRRVGAATGEGDDGETADVGDATEAPEPRAGRSSRGRRGRRGGRGRRKNGDAQSPS